MLPSRKQSERTSLFTIQCDFDDTITVREVGVALLGAFGPRNWRQIEEEYHSGLITVEECNRRQFAHVKISQETVQDFAVRTVEIRQGFSQLVDYCRNEGMRFVIVSNGLDLYIEPILVKLGLADLERYSGQAHITSEGIAVAYIDPTGIPVEKDFKIACLRHLQAGNQPVVCIGDSISDIPPALAADHVIARGELLDHFRRNNLPHFTFETFYDVQQHLQSLLHS